MSHPHVGVTTATVTSVAKSGRLSLVVVNYYRFRSDHPPGCQCRDRCALAHNLALRHLPLFAICSLVDPPFLKVR